MSGPKGIAYEVRAAEEARRRSTEAARARCQSLIAQVENAKAELTLLIPEKSQPAFSGQNQTAESNLDDLERLEALLGRHLQSLETEIDGQRKRLLQEQFAREFQSLSGIHLDAGGTDTRTHSRQAKIGLGSQNESERVASSLSHTVELLPEIMDAATRGYLARRAERAKEELSAGRIPSARKLLLSLQTDANRRLSAQNAAERIRKEVATVLLSLADLSGPQVEQLRREALIASNDDEVARLRRGAAGLRARHDEERDRLYVIKETRRALLDLGYEVDANFGDGGHVQTTIVTRSDLPDYGLRLQFSAQKRRLLTRVVTFGKPSPIRDTEVERATCRDIEELRQRWEARGIRASLDHHRDPGSVPLARLEAPRRATTRHTERWKTL